MSPLPAPTTTVAITYQAQPDQVENAVRKLTDLIAIVVATEPDCFGIQLYQDAADPARIFLFEEWTSREAYLGPHLQTPHLLAFKASSGPLFVGPPERTFWRLQAEFSGGGR
ncbi:MAG TPA: putative quinol monooxygenase [Thermoanaerobaculia bacterium]|jgi:quinol monooxygenase YgiN|nr:putative quinol monooxygenase [Thermoanaerobaculia bacterium]